MWGGRVTEWTQDQLIALARQKVWDAIRAGHSEYATTMTRELVRLCLARKNVAALNDS